MEYIPFAIARRYTCLLPGAILRLSNSLPEMITSGFRVQVPVPIVHSDIAWFVPEVFWLASFHHEDSKDEVNRLIGTRL